MLVRVISGVVALALAIALLYFAPPWAVTAVMALLCLLATRELLWGTKLVQNRRMVAVSCLAAAGGAGVEQFWARRRWCCRGRWRC